MEFKQQSQLLVVVFWFFAFHPLFLTSAEAVASTVFKKDVTNIQFYGDYIFVAGNGTLYKVAKNSSKITETVSTCKDIPHDQCDNTNTVLVINRVNKYLVLCGKGNYGQCQVGLIDNLTLSQVNSEMKVSVDKRDDVALVTDTGAITLGVLYGKEVDMVKNTQGYSFKYSLSTWKLNEKYTASLTKSLKLALKKDVGSYLIFYKAAFQSDGISYFITNQKKYEDDSAYVTKVVRVCQNDTDYNTYVDAVLKCTIKDNSYTLLQDAGIIELADASDKFFVGTFTAADDPTAVSGDSAICVANLTYLNEELDKNRNNVINCPYPTDAKKYLLYEGLPLCANEYSLSTCEGNEYTHYAIGETSIELTPVFNLSKDKGHITKVSGTVAPDNKTLVIVAGTSQGRVSKLRLDVIGSNISQADEYEQMTVRLNSSVRAINIQDPYVYILTKRRLDKLLVANCSRFQTCKETKSGNDPYCGWCVLQSKSTRENNCSNITHWISPGNVCVQIQLHLERIPASGSEQEIQLTVSNLKLDDLAASLSCKLRHDSNTVKATVDGDKVKCNITAPEEHTSAVLELRWNDIVLAESTVLFYICNEFDMCGECTNAQGEDSGCIWCKDSLACMKKSAICNSTVNTKTECPQLEGNNDTTYIPHGVASNVTLNAKNLPVSADIKYTCKACDGDTEFSATANTTSVTCNLKLNISENDTKTDPKRVCLVEVLYETNFKRRNLEEDFRKTVTVYRCENLAHDCTHCKALNENRYTCSWCGSKCKYNPKPCNDTCPSPRITEIVPNTSTPSGGTNVIMHGSDLINDKLYVTFEDKAGKDCVVVKINPNVNGDFKNQVPDKITCIVPDVTGAMNVTTSVKIGDKKSSSQPQFFYMVPKILSISPSTGPVSGGTLVTLTGDNFGIGNKRVKIRFNNAFPLNGCKVNQDKGKSTYSVECRTPMLKAGNVTFISIMIDQYPEYSSENNKKDLTFKYVSDPEVKDIYPRKCTESGGTSLTVTGENLNHAQNAKTTVKYDGQEKAQKCATIGKKQVICKCPEAPTSVKSDLKSLTDSATSKRRRKRDTDDTFEDESISVEVIVELDGFKQIYSLSYFLDPSLDSYQEVRIIESDEKTLVIKGRYLNLVATEEDIIVRIGIDICSVVKLTRTELMCVAYRTDVDNYRDQEVNVQIGNYRKTVGFVRYKHQFEVYIYIIAGVGGAVLAIITTVAVIAVVKFRRQGSKAKQLQDKLHNLEHEMVTVAREEFVDMHVTMSGVNQNLVEQGFPYHGYLEFASHIIFASRYIHIEPFVSRAQISERAKSGMETFEQLLCNKFFLLSIISTMEKQKKFFLREKANLAGHLCQVMMGKMEYLDEIIGLLIQNQVQGAVKKKHQKSLFRRSESITENLLNNWLFLCLYHHIKADTGSPLYLLYVVMQKTVEFGPIDDVTGHAKFTLCEEKLLKKWRSTDPDNRDEISFEAKTLNLRVIVDNGKQIYDCKALDCDTITQVKRKCLSQIYVNYPASQLAVDATDLKFNWHAGTCGLLPLADIDLTSKREGSWIRLNTLAHYNVPDDANMALVDPKCVDFQQEEDYENLGAAIMTQRLSGEADSLDLIQDTKDEDSPIQYWHLIKPDSLAEKQEKSAIDDLYLNRLITTKHSVVKYTTDLFDVILSQARCPAPVKRIFDLFDSLEAKHKLDPDTIHKWKSHSYLIRVWGSLMKDPSRLFDINVPSYVESSLGVVSQVFIDACSQQSTEVTKDTSPQKLSFTNVMKQYQEKVTPFYDDVKAKQQSQDDLRRYFDDVNKLQKQQNFTKSSSLHTIYDQLKPYMDTIIDELSQNKEASSLLLNQKLSQVMQLMEDDM